MPHLMGNDTVYVSRANAESASKGSSRFPKCCGASNRHRQFRREFVGPSAPGKHVSDVPRLSACVQMIGSDARGRIAVMQDPLPWGDRRDEQVVCDPVCKKGVGTSRFMRITYEPIATLIATPRPDPTVCFQIASDLSEEVDLEWQLSTCICTRMATEPMTTRRRRDEGFKFDIAQGASKQDAPTWFVLTGAGAVTPHRGVRRLDPKGPAAFRTGQPHRRIVRADLPGPPANALPMPGA